MHADACGCECIQAGAGSQLGFVLPGSPSHSSSEAARHLGSNNTVPCPMIGKLGEGEAMGK